MDNAVEDALVETSETSASVRLLVVGVAAVAIGVATTLVVRRLRRRGFVEAAVELDPDWKAAKKTVPAKATKTE